MSAAAVSSGSVAPGRRFSIVVLGTSLGGLEALKRVLGGLAADFPLPVTVVQHRAPSGPPVLAALLQRYCPLQVRDADDKERLVPGRVYLAPADYHLLVERGSLALSVDERVSFARPSIDVLFESAAASYGDRTVGVVLTGASADGARGAAAIHERGGVVVAQDPAEAEAPAMPQAAIDLGAVDRVLPLDEIAPWLNVICTPPA